MSQANANNTSSALETTKKRSLLDLALARGLDQVSKIYKTILTEPEVRIWQKCFEGEREEMLEWGFAEYFKTGEYPPKPADITKLIRQKRESMIPEQKPTSEEEWQAARADAKSYFSSPEYHAWLLKMKGMGL